MYRRKNNSLATIITLLFVFSIVSNVIGLIGFVIPLIAGGLFVALIAAFVYFGIKIGSGSEKNSKTISNVKLNDSGIINILKTLEDNKVQIDENTYLLLSDLDNINLDTIDIYLNEERIGSLNEFGKTQPRAFNNLCKNIAKKLKKQTNSEKIKDKITESITIEKNCTYYVNKLNNINNEIETKEVHDLVDQTIEHLKEIKRIEDEFGDKNDRTRKLYEYYLPMYVDILVNYDRLHDNAPQSDEFKQSEEKVLKTGSMINNALSNLSESLVENYRTSLNVDMKTLESILKKDGLISDINEKKESN